MSKTSTDLCRHALHGPTMGTRWTALFYAAPGFDPEPIRAALQAATDDVDTAMSTWKPDSELMRLNRAPTGTWLDLSPDLMAVIALGLAIGRATGGAFDIGMGDAVSAWGFGPEAASPAAIRAASAAARRPAWEVLELAGTRLRKHQDIRLDLNGIAKGHGVDRLAETLRQHGIASFLVGIDGELRAAGRRPDGEAWTVAIEQPDPARRAVHSVLAMGDAAIATSGDYRHWVDVGGRRLSHTMDPGRGLPLAGGPASVSVLAPSCAAADAWATALMVLGPERGGELALMHGIEALFLSRAASGKVTACAAGEIFASAEAAAA